MAEWTVAHYNQAGTKMGEALVTEPEFETSLNNVGWCNYSIPVGHYLARKRLGSDPMTDPTANAYVLLRDGVMIVSGLITSVQHGPYEPMLEVSGMEWMHLAERRIVPWVVDSFQHPYMTDSLDTATIARDLLQAIGFNPKVGSTTNYSIQLSGRTIGYAVEYGDTDSAFSKISALAEQEPGFDFFYDYALNTFYTYAPKRGSVIGLRLEAGANIKNVKIQNSGIRASKIWTVGSGLGQKFAAYRENASATATYRELSEGVDFGEVASQTFQDSRADAEIARASAPIKAISFDVVSSRIGNFWTIKLGDTVRVVSSDEYDTIDEERRVIQIHCSVNRQGDERITLGFEED